MMKFALYQPFVGFVRTVSAEDMMKELRSYADQIEEAIADETGIKPFLMCGKGFGVHCVEADQATSRWTDKEFCENLLFTS